MRNGWHTIEEGDHGTAVLYKDGEPVRLRTFRRDLDKAVDVAAQYVGEPLEVGEWQLEDGNPLDGLAHADCERSALAFPEGT